MKNQMIFMIFLCLFQTSFSQINESIKEKSKENQQNRNSRQKSYSGDEDYYYDGMDVGGCIDGCGCMLDLTGIIFEGIGTAHQHILYKQDTLPKVRSIDFSFQLGQADVWNWSVLPRIKLRHGVFSSDFRWYQSFEDHIDGKENYGTFDWQMLMFNIVNEPAVHWRIGTGVMFENFSGQAFHEHSTVLEIYLHPRWGLVMEGRIAPDYKTGILARQEFHLQLAFAFYESRKADWIVFFDFARANYYEEVKFNIYSLGIKLNIPFGK